MGDDRIIILVVLALKANQDDAARPRCSTEFVDLRNLVHILLSDVYRVEPLCCPLYG